MIGGRQKVAMRKFLRDLEGQLVEIVFHYRTNKKMTRDILRISSGRNNPGYYVGERQLVLRGVRRDPDLTTIHFYTDKAYEGRT